MWSYSRSLRKILNDFYFDNLSTKVVNLELKLRINSQHTENAALVCQN